MASRDEFKVSVVVPAYSRSGQLLRLLKSLEAQEKAPSYEVIIVDDCSVDDTEQTARAWTKEEHPFAASYIRLPQNEGPAKARKEVPRAESIGSYPGRLPVAHYQRRFSASSGHKEKH